MQNKLFPKKTYIKRNVDYVVKTTRLDLKSESQNNSAKTYKLVNIHFLLRNLAGS